MHTNEERVSMPLISVIVPTFNRAYCIARTIDSALAQTHSNLEIIVIDDGSSDETNAFIHDRYGSDSRVKYIFQENQGVSSARNTGFNESRGDFIALLDSDDVWRPWKLELQLSCLLQYPHVGMVWSDMEAVDAHGKIIDPRYIRTMYSCWSHYPDPLKLFSKVQPLIELSPNLNNYVANALFYSGNIFSQMIRGSLVHTSTVLLRRDRFDRVGYFNEQFKPAGEDFDFHLRTCKAGPVGFLDLVTIQYQRGMADQLACRANAIYVASNFLRTIKPYIMSCRNEIDLSDAELDSLLAEAHQWVGEEHFWLQQMYDARRSLISSIYYRPFQMRAWKFLMATLLPYRWFISRRTAQSAI
jgi:glycosyltransferase involved in cell wall biosynthesis